MLPAPPPLRATLHAIDRVGLTAAALQLAVPPLAGLLSPVLQLKLPPTLFVQLNVVLRAPFVLYVQLTCGRSEKYIAVPKPCTRLTTPGQRNGVAPVTSATSVLSGYKLSRPPWPECRVFSICVSVVVSTTRSPPVNAQRKTSSDCMAAQFR